MVEDLSTEAKTALAAFGERTTVEVPEGKLERGWERAVDRTRRPKRARWFAIGAIAAVALALVIVLRAPVAPPAVMLASADAQWQQHDDVVQLKLGQLKLQPREHVRVVTPQLQMDLQNARALVDVTTGQTVLAVEEGEVVYRTARGEWHLKAGERVVISDAPDAVTVASAGTVPSCTEGDVACLERVARGNGLAAEMALYKLGVSARDRGALEEAVHAFHEYGERFPSGMFAPEASIALMLSLRATGDLRAAAAEAERFGHEFPTEPRAGAVRAWREAMR